MGGMQGGGMNHRVCAFECFGQKCSIVDIAEMGGGRGWIPVDAHHLVIPAEIEMYGPADAARGSGDDDLHARPMTFRPFIFIRP